MIKKLTIVTFFCLSRRWLCPALEELELELLVPVLLEVFIQL